jgi:hypothetical protein
VGYPEGSLMKLCNCFLFFQLSLLSFPFYTVFILSGELIHSSMLLQLPLLLMGDLIRPWSRRSQVFGVPTKNWMKACRLQRSSRVLLREKKAGKYTPQGREWAWALSKVASEQHLHLKRQ